MCYLTAIAGGHRKTHALVLHDEKVAAFAGLDKPLNLHNVEPAKVTATLEEIVRLLVEKLRVNGHCDVNDFDLVNDKQNRVVLSLPGVSSYEDRKKGFYFLRTAGCANRGIIRVVDDTWSGLVGGLLRERGICAFAGSGASVFFGIDGFKLEKNYKLDGFGVIIGDFGSGFRTAVRLLERISRAIDAEQPWPDVRGLDPGFAKPDLQQWFDGLFESEDRGNWRQQVAKLAEVVTDAAKRPDADPTARQMVKEAAADMAETIKIGLRRFGEACRDIPIACQGGMFRGSNLYFQEVRRIVGEEFPNNEVRMALYHPVVGAALLARAAADEPYNPLIEYPPAQKGLPSLDVTREIIKSVFAQPQEILPNLTISATRKNPSLGDVPPI